MNDRDTISEILFQLWTGCLVTCLFALTCLLAIWMTPRVSAAIERLAEAEGGDDGGSIAPPNGGSIPPPPSELN